MDNGERIRNARRAQGLSQVALAEKVGCVTLSIINWEKGGRPLDVYREKLEAVLGISLKEEGSEGEKQEPPGGGSALQGG
jgi:ribosome-binding protein aMBF1 (putative translation factor)